MPELHRDTEDVVWNVDRSVGRRAVPVVRADHRPAVERRVVAAVAHRRRQGRGERLLLAGTRCPRGYVNKDTVDETGVFAYADSEHLALVRLNLGARAERVMDLP